MPDDPARRFEPARGPRRDVEAGKPSADVRGGSGYPKRKHEEKRHGKAKHGKQREDRGDRGRRDERPGRDSRDAHGSRDSRGARGGGRNERGHRGVRDGSRDSGHGGGRRPSRENKPSHVSARGQKLKGTVDKNSKGFGFLIFENRKIEDAFLNPRQAETLFHGDRIEVTIDSRGHVQSLKVLEHRFRELVGRYTPHPAGSERGGWVVYERKRAREEVWVPKASHRAKAGDWVKATLQFHEQGPFNVTAEITDVYGPDLPASADIGMISAEYNLIEEHSREAVKEAESFTLDLNDPHRKDLRDVPFITIDGETARDFDDAVFVERQSEGYVLWVAIADVSHYVMPGTALDQEARSRGTSVYFPERAFHMLPRALSENLCSLKPNEPRLAMTAKMFFDGKGKVQKTEIMESLIFSRRRATYNEIQKEWEANQKNPKWEYAPHFELYQLLRAARSKRGSIDFDLPEAELKVDSEGVPISIKNRERLDAHRLIEEFMISANEAVTVWAMDQQWPFVYRVHDEPAEQALQTFQKLAATVGVKVSLDVENIAQVLSDLVRRLEGHPAQALLNMQLLRSMKRAVYSATHGIHFGLASGAYTHFTSPIRRYPDLVVHRMLRQALRVQKKREQKPKDMDKLERDLEEIAEHCSYRERIASDAERESIRLKQVRAMIPHLGDEFESKVIGMSKAGLFVEIQDPYCEGLISTESMVDDFYEYNEDRMIFAGKRKKVTFKIGDMLKVRCLRADLDRRQIDFGLLGKNDRVDRSRRA